MSHIRFLVHGVIVGTLLTKTCCQTDYYRCAGLATAAAGYAASAGLQIANAASTCAPDGEPDTCSRDIFLAVSALSRAAVLGTGAGTACGGPRSRCATSITQASTFFSSAAASGSEAARRARRGEWEKARREVDKMGSRLRDAGRAVTGAEAFCKDLANSTQQPRPNWVGFCVSDSLRAATAIAAAGIAINGAVVDCPTKPAECARHASFTVAMLAKLAEQSANTAQICGYTGKARCAALASSVAVNMAEAAGEAGTLAVDLGVEENDDVVNDMARVADNLQAMSQRIGQAAHICENPDTPIDPQQLNIGQCVGDVISASGFVASMGFEINFATADCLEENTQDLAGTATCSQDVTYTMALAAHVADQLMFATEDCVFGSTFNTICGSSISLAVEAIGEAAYAGSQIAIWSVDDDGGPAFDDVRGSVQDLSTSMSQFTSTLSTAVRICTVEALGLQQKQGSEDELEKELRGYKGPWQNSPLTESREPKLAPFLESWVKQVREKRTKRMPWTKTALISGILMGGVSFVLVLRTFGPVLRFLRSTKGTETTDERTSDFPSQELSPLTSHSSMGA